MKFPDLFGQFKRNLEDRWQKLYRLAFAWTHDSHLAKDLVQETMVKALRSRQQLRNDKALDAWLCSILANTWRDYCRKANPITDLEEISLTDDISAEQEHNRMEIVYQVRNAIAKLTMDQRQIVTLIDLEGFSYNEVAEILKIPIGTVMSRLCRARNKLKQYLAKDAALESNIQSEPHLWRVK